MLFQCTSSGATMGIDSGFGSADMDCESRHISPKKTLIELPQSFNHSSEKIYLMVVNICIDTLELF